MYKNCELLKFNKAKLEIKAFCSLLLRFYLMKQKINTNTSYTN